MSLQLADIPLITFCLPPSHFLHLSFSPLHLSYIDGELGAVWELESFQRYIIYVGSLSCKTPPLRFLLLPCLISKRPSSPCWGAFSQACMCVCVCFITEVKEKMRNKLRMCASLRCVCCAPLSCHRVKRAREEKGRRREESAVWRGNVRNVAGIHS